MIRGFMNDGNIDYKSHHAVDSLAFGHCDFSYRNLGRPSKVQVKQLANAFEVIVDGRRCFWSDKVCLEYEQEGGNQLTSKYRLDYRQDTTSGCPRLQLIRPTPSKSTNLSLQQLQV